MGGCCGLKQEINIFRIKNYIVKNLSSSEGNDETVTDSKSGIKID